MIFRKTSLSKFSSKFELGEISLWETFSRIRKNIFLENLSFFKHKMRSLLQLNSRWAGPPCPGRIKMPPISASRSLRARDSRYPNSVRAFSDSRKVKRLHQMIFSKDPVKIRGNAHGNAVIWQFTMIRPIGKVEFCKSRHFLLHRTFYWKVALNFRLWRELVRRLFASVEHLHRKNGSSSFLLLVTSRKVLSTKESLVERFWCFQWKPFIQNSRLP